MDPSPDELAGVVDLFGTLTREELHGAIADLAARAGTRFEPAELDERIDEAVAAYYLVPVGEGPDAALASGPAALPVLPEGGEDLPHLLEADARSVDRSRLADRTEERIRADAARAVNAGDEDRALKLLDVCYELDAWAGVETAEIRDRLERFLG